MVDDSSNQNYLKSKTGGRIRDERSRAIRSTNVSVVDKADVKSEYRRFLDEFKQFERSRGASRATAQQHSDMIVVCIGSLKKIRRKVSWDDVTADDLDSILKDLEADGVRHAGSHVRVFAAFLSFMTGSEPLIDTGRYGIQAGNRHLLMSRPDEDGNRRREGTPEERADIEHRYRKDLDAFMEHESSLDVSPNTRANHRRGVDACIFVLEKTRGPLILSEITREDIASLRDYLEDFGIDPDGRVNLFVKFLAFITGSEPLIEQRWPISSRCRWPSTFKTGFRFERELDGYDSMLRAKGDTQGTIDGCRSRIVVCCGIMESIENGFGLRDVDAAMLDSLRAELEKTYAPCRSSTFVSTFSDFIRFATGRDLSAERKGRSGYRIVFEPETDNDAGFVEHLREYIGFMEDWGYKDHTIRSRISMNTVCYRKLKGIKGDFRLEDVTSLDIRMLRNSFEGYSEGTIRQNIYAFGWFLDHATGYNPCEDARLIFNSGMESRQFIFSDDWTRIYENADTMGRLILSLGATMGLRRKEILALRMEDILDGRLRIRGKGVGSDGKVVVMEMTELVRKDLKDYLVVRSQVLSIFGDRTGGVLLINMTRKNIGKALNERSFGTFLDNLQEKSGISFTSHCLRRFFCTTMSDAGVDLDTIRRMMRHSSLDTTLKCYLHADPRKMNGAVSKINDVFAAITN